MSQKGSALYEQIYNHYKEQILSGELEVDSKLPTEAELMETFTVSRITAKRALDELEHDGYIRRRRGSGSYVNGLKERFSAVQTELCHIGFVIPSGVEGEGPFFTMMKGATDYLCRHHCQLVLYNSGRNEERENKTLMQAREDGCDGILYYPGPVETARGILFRMASVKYPIVMLDKAMDNIPITYVVSDNVEGNYVLAQHLIAKGHRKIAFITVDNGLANTTGERFLGLCRGASAAGLPDESIVLRGVFSDKDDLLSQIHVYDEEAVKRLVPIIQTLRQQNITAICTLNDNLAMKVYQAMHRLSYNIPEDMAVAGFDDADYAQYASPGLTTVKQDFYRIGYIAAKELYHQIRNAGYIPVRRVIPTLLIERDSV